MRNVFFLFLLCTIGTALFSQTFGGVVKLEEVGLSIALEVDSEKSMVTITMSGPVEQWYAFGFGSKIMKGTYAIAISDRGIEERFLDGRNEGEVLDKSITVLSDVTANGIRTVVVKRLIKGKGEKYFNFPRKAAALNLIYAVGKNEKPNKKHGEKGTAILILD